MSFNLYFAGTQAKEVNKYMVDNDCAKLFSYLNDKKEIEQFIKDKKDNLLFIDSGAYSVAHAGKTVDIDEYIEWINNHSDNCDAFAELDSIPYPVLNHTTAQKSINESYKNYLYMHERVKCPEKLLYVFHFGEPQDKFLKIINTPINGKLPEYIGMGGRHGVSTKEHDKYFQRMFDIIKHSHNPNIKVHAFGMTVLDLLEKYPFYSADSTTWLMLGINGNIITRTNGIISVSKKSLSDSNSFLNLANEHKQEVINELCEHGFTLEQIKDDYKQRLIWNIKYYKEWADNYSYKSSDISRNNLF